VTGGRRDFHNEELHDLHYSANIRMIKSQRIVRWTGHLAWTET
jgi:hypothetical protein